MEKKSSLFSGWVFLPISLLLLLLDQLSKFLATLFFSLGEGLKITSFFNLYLVHNHGAAFSFLANAGGWQKGFFIGVSSVVSLIILIWLFKLKARQQKLLCLALSLLLGGAVGNLIDRILYGYVIDFLDFHWQQYHWPVFNFADVGISIGVFLLLIDSIKNRKTK